MGKFITYTCTNCGFEECYYTGGGFLSDDYFEESKKLSNKLKTDSKNGKYGEMVQAIANADDGNLIYSCQTEIFQCEDCKKLLVRREKRITLCSRHKEYDLNIDIEFKQKCPECGNKDFKKISFKSPPICPKCKKQLLEIKNFGNWD